MFKTGFIVAGVLLFASCTIGPTAEPLAEPPYIENEADLGPFCVDTGPRQVLPLALWDEYARSTTNRVCIGSADRVEPAHTHQFVREFDDRIEIYEMSARGRGPAMTIRLDEGGSIQRVYFSGALQMMIRHSFLPQIPPTFGEFIREADGRCQDTSWIVNSQVFRVQECHNESYNIDVCVAAERELCDSMEH